MSFILNSLYLFQSKDIMKILRTLINVIHFKEFIFILKYTRRVFGCKSIIGLHKYIFFLNIIVDTY